MPAKIRVVVIDDHLSIRQMLERIFALDEQYELAGHAGSGLKGLEICRKLKPRVAIVDLLLPEMSGVEVLRALRAEGRDTRVLIYSGTLNQTLIANALDAKPHGFVHKEDSLTTLLDAMRTVAQGGSYFTPFVMAFAERAVAGTSTLTLLSSRERTVLKLVAEGCSSKQIADRLDIATKTVEHHRTAIMQKLGVHDIAGLTRLAVREGLVAND